MVIKSSTSFTYAGVPSEIMGVVNVSVDSGLQSEPFIAPRTIEEISVPGRDAPYFHRVSRVPLSFQLSFLFNGGWDTQKIRKVAAWLNQDRYQPLTFEDKPNATYYALVADDPIIVHNGLRQGYVTLTFRCNSPYGYSPVYLSPIFPASTFTLDNRGDTLLAPEIWVRTINAGTVTINNTTRGTQTTFTGLAAGETLYMEGEQEVITSSVPSVFRFSNYNNVPFALSPGINSISLSGSATLQVRAQWRYL